MARPLPKPGRRAWLIAFAAAPLLLGAVARDAETRARHRAEIAELSTAEREHLERNFAEYRRMPEAERESLRRLHQAVEADRSGSGKLGGALDAYEDWLNTITPWQRRELREEADPERRLDLVSKLRQEQREAAQKQREARGGHGRPPFPRLRGPELAEAIGLIERGLQPAEAEREWLNQAKPPARYFRVLTLALKQAHDDRAAGGRWPSDDLMRGLIEKFSDPRHRKAIDDAPPEVRRGMLYWILERSVEDAWRDARRPKDQKGWFVESYKNLSPAERERLDRMSPGDRNREFWNRYRHEEGQELQQLTQELRELRERTFPMWPPFGERGRPGGGDRDRDRDRDRR